MIRSRFAVLGALLGALLLAAPAGAAENPRQGLIASKAPGVVSVKITAKISGSFGEQAVDQEQNRTVSGVVVDAAGLVLVAADAVALPRRFTRMSTTLKLTPTSIRVIFPGDEAEYEAILGATDTKLGLAYLLIRDLKGRKADPLDMSKSIEPAVGETLYAVTRLGQGFDYAPVCQSASVAGQVSKPRQMWVIDGPAVEEGHPLYNAAGLLAGIMISQEGVGEGGGELVFLLPLKIAAASFERGLKAAQKELEDLKVREAEAAAKAAEKPAEPAAAEPEQPK